MSKFHIRADGTAGECFASVKECPLGASRHFDTLEDANRVSQMIMEQKFGTFGVDENKVKEAETPRTKQKSYDNLRMYHNEIYGFDNEKKELAKAGVKKLEARKSELEFTLKQVKAESTSKQEDSDKVKSNIAFIDKTIDERNEQYRKKWLRDYEREKKKRKENEEKENRARLRESNMSRGNEPSGCGGGGGSGCGGC